MITAGEWTRCWLKFKSGMLERTLKIHSTSGHHRKSLIYACWLSINSILSLSLSLSLSLWLKTAMKQTLNLSQLRSLAKRSGMQFHVFGGSLFISLIHLPSLLLLRRSNENKKKRKTRFHYWDVPSKQCVHSFNQQTWFKVRFHANWSFREFGWLPIKIRKA